MTLQILDHNLVNPGEKIKFPSAIDLHKWLVAIVKPEHPWYYESSKCAPQFALKHLRAAWEDCFNLDGTIKVINHFKIQVPKIGILRTYERLPHGYKPKNVTISRQADSWYVSFKVEIEPQSTLKTVDVVGVDLGVKTLAYLSTGIVFQGAKSYRKYEKKLT